MHAMRIAVGLVLFGLLLTFLSLYGVAPGIGWFGLLALACGALLAIVLTLTGEMEEERALGRERQI